MTETPKPKPEPVPQPPPDWLAAQAAALKTARKPKPKGVYRRRW